MTQGSPRRLQTSGSQIAPLAVAWTVFAVYGSLVPLQFQPVGFSEALDTFLRLPPVSTRAGTHADLVSNVLLFVPLTFLWTGALALNRDLATRIVVALGVVSAAVAFSIALEFTQIWFVDRNVSLNDIVAETAGGVLGAGLWLMGGQRWTTDAGRHVERLRPRSPGEWLLALYVVSLIVLSTFPLDLTMSVTELYHKLRRGQIVVFPFWRLYSSAAAVAQYTVSFATLVPVGFWIARRARDWHAHVPPMRAALVCGFAIAGAIELVQLLTLSRVADVTDVILGTAGSAAGAWLAARGIGRT